MAGCLNGARVSWLASLGLFVIGCTDPVASAGTDDTTTTSDGSTSSSTSPTTTIDPSTSTSLGDSTTETTGDPTEGTTAYETTGNETSEGTFPTTETTESSESTTESSTTDTAETTTTDATTTETSDTMMEASESSTDPTGIVFLVDPDAGVGPAECSLWDQDCPRGEKCMPWANDGGNVWNSTRCSPIDENPGAPGDVCTVEGSNVSGVDSCQLAAMCWNVDAETNEGECISMCQGSEANPVCADPQTSCTIVNDGLLILCLPACDPLLQDCDNGEACLAVVDSFVCLPDASGELGVQNDPCEYLNVCDPGLACLNAELVPGCMAFGCCSQFCALDEGNAPCVAGLGAMGECLPWYEEGVAPPGYENVGICGDPP